jgi:hypothetical protein
MGVAARARGPRSEQEEQGRRPEQGRARRAMEAKVVRGTVVLWAVRRPGDRGKLQDAPGAGLQGAGMRALGPWRRSLGWVRSGCAAGRERRFWGRSSWGIRLGAVGPERAPRLGSLETGAEAPPDQPYSAGRLRAGERPGHQSRLPLKAWSAKLRPSRPKLAVEPKSGRNRIKIDGRGAQCASLQTAVWLQTGGFALFRYPWFCIAAPTPPLGLGTAGHGTAALRQRRRGTNFTGAIAWRADEHAHRVPGGWRQSVILDRAKGNSHFAYARASFLGRSCFFENFFPAKLTCAIAPQVSLLPGRGTSPSGSPTSLRKPGPPPSSQREAWTACVESRGACPPPQERGAR